MDKVTMMSFINSVREGHADSLKLLDQVKGFIADILSMLVNIFAPRKIVLFGELAELGDILLDGVRERVSENIIKENSNGLKIMASEFGRNLGAMGAAAMVMQNAFEFLEEKEEDQTVEHPVSVENLKGNVEFDHVHFGYNPDKIIINDFSAKVKEGQKIAIVGPTGAGKTTMIKLLMRFYDVNDGSIKIDGHDIRDFNRSELREMFGMVLQDTWLFHGSIRENIRYGKLDATDEEVIQAAKAAHVHRFVKTLPGGYDMELNEEASNVSQGQKQLLTIARAILADPKILILDEATSSVDTRTEVLIQKAMDNLMKGRTSFVIAHRLSTIRDADLILVMKDGDIVEQGNHEELLAKGGFYADLYNSQFENAGECA